MFEHPHNSGILDMSRGVKIMKLTSAVSSLLMCKSNVLVLHPHIRHTEDDTESIRPGALQNQHKDPPR